MPKVATEVGKRYRDTIKGVVGECVARQDAKEDHPAIAQLRLDRHHIEGSPEQIAAHTDVPEGQAAPEILADMRWFDEDRLVEA